MRASLLWLVIALFLALAKDVAGSPGTVDATHCTSDSDCYYGIEPRYCRDGRCVYESMVYEGDAANSTAAVSAAREILSILVTLLLVVGMWV